MTLPEGVITAGVLSGAGVIHNEGVLRVDPAKVSVKVTGQHHEVVFDYADGSTPVAKRTVFASFMRIAGVSMPANPTWADHDFRGWNTKADGSGQSFTDLDTLAGSSADGSPVVTTLYAKWSEHDALRRVKNRLDGCTGTVANPTRVTLTEDLIAAGDELVVTCHVVLDVAGHRFEVGGIDISGSGSLTITGGAVTVGQVTGEGRVVNRGVLLADPATVKVPVRERHYRVEFDTRGGSATPGSRTVFADTLKAGEKAMPADPTRAGHDFAGWNTKVDGTGDVVSDTLVLPGSSADGTAAVVMAYAQWKAHPPADPGPLTIERPTVTGTARYLDTLTADQPLPNIAGIKVAYEWQTRVVLRDAEGKRTGFGPWTPIAGATQATYSPARNLIGRQVRVITTVSAPQRASVTGRRFGGMVTKAVFAHPAKRLTLKAGKRKVTITGLEAWLRTLPQGAKVTYRWHVGGKRLTGKANTRKVLRLKPAHTGKRVRVTVRVKAPGYRNKGVISSRLRLR